MELLRLRLQPLEEEGRFLVIPQDRSSGKGSLPYAGRHLRTILWVLDLSDYMPAKFDQNEQKWLRKREWLVETEKGSTTFSEDVYVKIGRELYESQFPPGSKVRAIVENGLVKAEENSRLLHIQFVIEENKAEMLGRYPWELMHTGDRDRGFLAHRPVSFSRSIAQETAPPRLPLNTNLNMLLISSRPVSLDNENPVTSLSATEFSAIYTALQEVKDVNVEQLEPPTFDALETYLRNHQGADLPQIIHFDGHGILGYRCSRCGTMHRRWQSLCRKCGKALSKNRESYLVFENQQKAADYRDSMEFGELIERYRIKEKESGKPPQGVVLVVLSACRTAVGLENRSIFSGFAQNQIKFRVPAVVAMQFPVEEGAAATFAEEFYSSIGQKESLALAVRKARAAMGIQGNQWYRPVLYLRWQDNEGGQLFQTISESDRRAKPTPPPMIDLIGRDELLEQIKKELLGLDKYPDVILLQTPGIGKSVLSYYLVNDSEIGARFPDGILWAALGKEPDIREELTTWAQQLQIAREDFVALPNDSKRTKIIRDRIGQERMLILLDDVWESKHIKNLLVGGPNCATIMTTRRDEVVGSFLRESKPKHYVVPELSTEDGLKLLREYAPEMVDQEPDKAQELVAAVGRLPMALVLVGKYLSSASRSAQTRAIRKALKNLKDAEERIKLEGKHEWYQPEDAPLSLQASIRMSEEELNPVVRLVFHAISIFRAKPKLFSLRATAAVCGGMEEFSQYEEIDELEDVIYDILYDVLFKEGLLELIPSVEDEADDLDPEEDVWAYEQISVKFTMPQVIADYGRLELQEEEAREMHDHAAEYHQMCLLNYEEEGREGAATSYERMYAYEDPEWQRVKASWLYHLAHTEPVHANMAFLRLYLDAFWWWGDYLDFRPFCEELLMEWRAMVAAKEDHQWLELVETFHHAYPWGWEKHKRGGEDEWQAVEEAILALRQRGGFDGDVADFADDDERRHLRVITDIYLAESRQYRDVNDEQADSYYEEALAILEEEGEESDDYWNIPWVKYQMSDLYLARGKHERALDLAAESRDLAISVVNDVINRDLEVIANDYRVEGDVFWEQEEWEKAFRHYTVALFFAWGFHATGGPPDFYSLEFHTEMVKRTRRRLHELWAGGRVQETVRVCTAIYEFWEPYWRELGREPKPNEIQRLLEGGAWDELEKQLFPPKPTHVEIHEGEESECYQRTLRLFPEMFAVLSL